MDSLLNRLVGRWSLRGRMGDADLYQEVSARWVLKDLFVEMRFRPVEVGKNGNPDYEAIYLLGHDIKADRYVLHLFDTAGVSSKPVVGVGGREGNSIVFRFEYDVGPWYNTFTWIPTSKTWRNTITYEEGGAKRVFADKELVFLVDGAGRPSQPDPPT